MKSLFNKNDAGTQRRRLLESNLRDLREILRLLMQVASRNQKVLLLSPAAGAPAYAQKSMAERAAATVAVLQEKTKESIAQ